MPNDKDKEPKDAEQCDEESVKQKAGSDVAKGDQSPKWAVDLAAKLDKLTDAILATATPVKKADKEYPDPDDEEVPKKKQKEPKEEDVEEEPKKKKVPKDEDEEKADEEEPEKYPYGEDKLKNMVEAAIKASEPSISKMVEGAIAKRLVESPPAEKKGLAPPAGDAQGVELTDEQFGQLTFADVHRLAKKLGAP